MTVAKWITMAACLGVMLVLTVGCGHPADGPTTPAVDDHDHHADHDHPSEGPHGGELIELGEEEYHAELVHDEQAGSVTIYILDAAAKTAVPSTALELTINLKHDGQAEQFKLTASPAAGDPPGQSSRFVSSDAELGEDLEHEGAEPQLVITIDGKQYRGKIQHDHHDHDHAEEGHSH